MKYLIPILAVVALSSMAYDSKASENIGSVHLVTCLEGWENELESGYFIALSDLNKPGVYFKGLRVVKTKFGCKVEQTTTVWESPKCDGLKISQPLEGFCG